VIAGVEGSCLVAVADCAAPQEVSRLGEAGAEVAVLPEREGRVDLAALMALLGDRDVMSVLLEGGPTLAAGALAQGLVDKLALFYAPLLIGPREWRHRCSRCGRASGCSTPGHRRGAADGARHPSDGLPCSRD